MQVLAVFQRTLFKIMFSVGALSNFVHLSHTMRGRPLVIFSSMVLRTASWNIHMTKFSSQLNLSNGPWICTFIQLLAKLSPNSVATLEVPYSIHIIVWYPYLIGTIGTKSQHLTHFLDLLSDMLNICVVSLPLYCLSTNITTWFRFRY